MDNKNIVGEEFPATGKFPEGGCVGEFWFFGEGVGTSVDLGVGVITLMEGLGVDFTVGVALGAIVGKGGLFVGIN